MTNKGDQKNAPRQRTKRNRSETDGSQKLKGTRTRISKAQKTDMTPVDTPTTRKNPTKKMMLGGGGLNEPRSLKGISFKELYVESYKTWNGNTPGNLKVEGKTQNHSRASQILDVMNWFCTDIEKTIMKSEGNDVLKGLIAQNLSNCVAHSTSSKYVELKIKKKPRTLTMQAGRTYKAIPCTAWDDYRQAINKASKLAKLKPWKYTAEICKQTREAYRASNYFPECIKLPEDKPKKRQYKPKAKPTGNKILVPGQLKKKVSSTAKKSSPPKRPRKKKPKTAAKPTTESLPTSNETDNMDDEEPELLTQLPGTAITSDNA